MFTRGGRGFIGCVALVLVLAACGGSPASDAPTTSPAPSASTSAPPSAGTTGVPTAPTRPSDGESTGPAETTETTAPAGDEPGQEMPEDVDRQSEPAPTGTAAEALVPFFAAVDEIDGRLRTAAEAVNAGLGEDTATFDQSTLDAIDAAVPWPAADAIPSGLDPATEQAVLLVYSDLTSRFGAMAGGDCVQRGTVPRESLGADCFVRGHEAKVRMPGDVRAARAAAAASAVDPPDPSAPESAEVQLRIEYINKANLGCGTVGGFIATDPIPVEWASEPSSDPTLPPTDGKVNGVRFRATYTESDGWAVNLLAC